MTLRGGNCKMPHDYWQECEIPDCRNEVPKAKAICDECHGGF
jgi:hypothetical protein